MTYQYFRLNTFHEITDGSVDFEKELVDIFISDTQKTLLKIQENMNNEDFEKVSFFAHRIKSSLQIFDMVEALQCIEVIENKTKKYEINKISENVKILDRICLDVINQIKQIKNK